MVRTFTLALVLWSSSCLGAEDLKTLPPKIDGVEPKAMMHTYLMERLREAVDRHDATYEAIKTPEQATAYQQRMRQFFIDQLGGFPERTPLNSKIAGKQDRGAYRVEKVVFESRPRHYVTAVLYLPNTAPPHPGVLVPCGHSANGKAEGAYQRACILLATNGFVVLCYDPIDQGERHQLLSDQGKPLAAGTTGHSMIGVGSILLGLNTASYRVWDGMRAIDYLQSRPEVDGERIGCTGNSGGGTLTSYLMALDDRIVCAAPSCYLTSFRRLMEKAGPQDLEQNIHGQIAYGLDHAEYVMIRATKPTLMCCATRDFFDINGSWESFRQAKRFYTRLGFSERVDLIETDAPHGFSTQLRTGATRWMRRWLLNKDDAITEPQPEVAVAKDAEMLCTPQGEVMRLPGARSVYDFNADFESRLAQGRKKLWQAAEKSSALEQVRKISGIRELAALPKVKCEAVGEVKRPGYRIEKLVLRPGPGIWLAALGFVPEKQSGPPCLYLHAEGKQADAAPGGPIEKLVQAGHLVLAADLRGIGETQGAGGKTLFGPEWKDVSLAYMLDMSYLAMRAEDVLNCARFLQTYRAEGKPRPVRLVSIGRVGPPALHAAALEPQLFASAELRGCLRSWADVVRTPKASNQYVNVVHGALKVYDLPDLLAALPKGKATVRGALDALEQPASGK